MTQEPTTRTRSRGTGCAALAISAVALGIVAVCLAVTAAVTGFLERPDPPPEELLGKKSGLTEYRLKRAVEDGTLTDAEIAYAAGGRWSAVRERSTIRVVVGYSPGPVCYRYEIPYPLNGTTAVHRSRLDACPAP
ncbi:hypothetical protein [Streptomyces sp. NBC_01022]|uniref:hypothetical protein n=1 Tax=Streptomyces sp. NBC_01022 TaxID=2903723 RepID=UPI002DDBE26D|nr:hypothetical protein [Streptomyces sp. NBC_01022]WRZ84370.1 hypothetical protein OG316_30975 [Streptomyces sp. NBC_01022]